MFVKIVIEEAKEEIINELLEMKKKLNKDEYLTYILNRCSEDDRVLDALYYISDNKDNGIKEQEYDLTRMLNDDSEAPYIIGRLMTEYENIF